MANYRISDASLTAVANAIRAKGGTSSQLAFPAEFITAIEAIETGAGGGSIVRKKGTFVGTGTNVVTINCDFEPEVVFIYGDTTSDVSIVGINTIILIKDAYAFCKYDGSAANAVTSMTVKDTGVVGLNTDDASNAYNYKGTFENGVCTLQSYRYAPQMYLSSALTYTYELIGVSESSGSDAIDHEDLPDYVKAEALAVAERVKPKIQNDSIVILTGSDGHQIETGSNAADTMAGNLHAGMAMKALGYMLPFDFACYLGDYTAGSGTTGIEEGLGHFASINSYIDEAFRGLAQFRTVGNHDPLSYSYNQNGRVLTQAELYELVGKYNDDGVTVMGSRVAGYCYRDFTAKNLRVICLNTADANNTSQGGTEAVSDAQKKWFADTLISTPQDYGIIILAHHPLDWGNIMSTSHVLRAYVEEQSSINIGGTTYSFTNKNKSAWILQIHGHVHTFTVDNLHWNNGGTGVAYNVKRIALPCTNFVRTNEYGNNGAPEYYGIEFGTPGDTQSKVSGTAKDTAFCVIVINPSEQKAYAINYGAGYDREVYWGEVAVPVTGVTLSASTGTLNPGSSLTLTATVAPSNATNKGVVWSTSDSSVTTVSNGLVTAVGVGNATITATTQDGGFTATFALTVEAAPQGDLIDVIGYTDGQRLSLGDGTYRETSGGVVIEYIDLNQYRQSDNTVVIRTKGALFQSWQSGSQYNNNAYVFYNASKAFTVSSYLTEGSTSHGGITVTRTFAGDADNTMTLTITGIGANVTTGSYHYLRFCGLGSGANVDLRINENFD